MPRSRKKAERRRCCSYSVENRMYYGGGASDKRQWHAAGTASDRGAICWRTREAMIRHARHRTFAYTWRCATSCDDTDVRARRRGAEVLTVLRPVCA